MEIPVLSNLLQCSISLLMTIIFFYITNQNFPYCNLCPTLSPIWTYKNQFSSSFSVSHCMQERCQWFLSLTCPSGLKPLPWPQSSHVRWPLLSLRVSCGCSKPGQAIPEPEEPSRGEQCFPWSCCSVCTAAAVPCHPARAPCASTGTQNSSAELLLSHLVPSLSLSCSCSSKIPSQPLLSTLESLKSALWAQVRFLKKAAGKRYSP